MNYPKYTYRKSTGIYYFRLVKLFPGTSRNIEIRFSLRTRVPYEAKVRAMKAWLHAQHLLMTGTHSSTDITTAVKSISFTTECAPTQSRSNLINGANPPALVCQSIDKSAMLRDEFTAYANRKIENGQWTDKTTLEYESILDMFIEIVGNKKVVALNKDDIEIYVNVVSHLPCNRKKKPEYKRLSAQDAAKKNKATGGITLSPRQRKKYLTTISYVSTEPTSLPIPLERYVPGFEGENGTRDVIYVYQATLNAGGTATFDWSARGDYMVSEGTISMYHGSWECRKDGTLVMTTIGAYYQPTGYNPYQDAPVTDIEIGGHNRHNRLFSVEDDDTIVLRQTIRRFYYPDQDPMDPLDGFPRALGKPDLVFTRLSPSTEGLDLP